MADIAINNVKREFESWNELGIVSSLSNWASTRSELERAKSLNPNEPEYYRLEGLLYEWRFFVEGLPYSSTEMIAMRQRAIDAYRESAALRPAWPDGWAHLARQKALLGQVDAEFDLAIARATTLGAWEPRIQLLVAETGGWAWPNLSEATRTAVIENIQRGLTKTSTDRALISQLQSSELLITAVCPLLKQTMLTARARQACQ